jgi:hypothetical protein
MLYPRGQVGFRAGLDAVEMRILSPCRESNAGLPVRSPPLYYFFIIVSGVRLNPLGSAPTTGLLYQPQMIDEGECGEIGGLKIGRGNLSTRRKPAPAPLCRPQIPHDQTRTRTRAIAVESQRLTARAMARPVIILTGLIRLRRNKVTNIIFINEGTSILHEQR